MDKDRLEKRIATLGKLIQEQLSLKFEYGVITQKPKLEKPRRRLFNNSKYFS